MVMPVTSTMVATNGAEALAGSNPKRFKSKGNVEPIIVPHNTIPTKLPATVKPINR